MNSEDPPDLLDEVALGALLADGDEHFRVEVLATCESTNTLLVERSANGAPHASVLACEHQTHGRGRRGARWVSSPGGSLVFSLLWRFERGLADLPGLSLAVAVGVARALDVDVARKFDSVGGPGVRLKWPNDLLFEGRKLGGILIEASEGPDGGSAAVIGVGLNVKLDQLVRSQVEVPVADLAEMGRAPSRTQLLACMLLHLAPVLRQFELQGFEPLRQEWMRRHAWQDREVALEVSGRRVARGEAVGVDTDGALLLRSAGNVERYHSGELSLRAS